MNSTIIYIVIITLFVLLMIYIGFRIVSKKIKSSTVLPKDVDFQSSLNNLDTIISGVSKKEDRIEKKEVENETIEHQNAKVKKVTSVTKAKKLKESKIITQKTFIAKEILDRKKDLD